MLPSLSEVTSCLARKCAVFFRFNNRDLLGCSKPVEDFHMFVHSRMQSIFRGIRKVVNGNELLPLCHLNGNSKSADMITKPCRVSVSDMQQDSR